MNQKDNLYPQYLSTKDVSVLLDISILVVKKWCEEKKLDAVKTYKDYGDWKISVEQFQKTEEMKTKYEKFIKEKYEKQIRTNNALKNLDLSNSDEYKNYIKSITED